MTPEDALIVARGLLAAADDTLMSRRALMRGRPFAARILAARAARRRDDARWYQETQGRRS